MGKIFLIEDWQARLEPKPFSHMRPNLKVIISFAVGLLGVAFLCIGPLADVLFVDKQEFVINAPQSIGEDIKVVITEYRRGFYISGGHGWTLGSKKRSHDVLFEHKGKAIRWNGPGVPIILQSNGDTIYLATFDRETSLLKTDFRCYRWSDQWTEISSNTFPQELTRRNNLIRLDSSSEASDAEELSSSLLARFWFCVFNNLHDWEVSDSDIDANFINSYQATAFAP